MRISLAAVTAVMLVAGVMPVLADGAFIRRYVPAIDPSSHARDISEPSQKALIVHGDGIERLILQVAYKGEVSEFAWLVPTPSRPTVTKVQFPIFHTLHTQTAPRLRYWFDADQRMYYSKLAHDATATGATMAYSPGVQVLEEKQVGFYDIAVLRATVAADLLSWLKTNRYEIDAKLEPVLSDYIGRGWVFTAMRINTAHQAGAAERLHSGVLDSLEFTFPASEPIYPLKVSSLNNGPTELLLYVSTDHRVAHPLMTTACSIEFPTDQFLAAMERVRPPSDDVPRMIRRLSFLVERVRHTRDYWPQPLSRLTKLTATLTAAQMTHDLVLGPAESNDILPVGTASPPFAENLGATTLMVSGLVVPYPNSLLVLGALVLIGLSLWGRRRWRIWLAAGVVYVMVGLLIGGNQGYPRGVPDYETVGITVMVVVAALLVAAAAALTVCLRRRRTAT